MLLIPDSLFSALQFTVLVLQTDTASASYRTRLSSTPHFCTAKEASSARSPHRRDNAKLETYRPGMKYKLLPGENHHYQQAIVEENRGHPSRLACEQVKGKVPCSPKNQNCQVTA